LDFLSLSNRGLSSYGARIPLAYRPGFSAMEVEADFVEKMYGG